MLPEPLETYVWAPGLPRAANRQAGMGHQVSRSATQLRELAALPVSAVIAVLTIGLCFMLAVFNAVGRVASTRVLADRASGKLCDTPEGYR
jgi:hypothetical protein